MCIKIRLHGLDRVLHGNASAIEDLSVIQDEIKRLERIVEDFLQFVHPSAPRVQTFSAATLFDQLKGLFGPRLEAAGIRWQVEAPPEVAVRADPQQLKQVLINLIQNALENTASGGTITLRAAACPARLPSAPAAGTVLEVADTGKGIPPSVAKRMFDPFFSTKETGTGIGLSIAAGIVEKHGGSIRYQTAAGKGTTFSINLPGVEKSKYET
jgi:signal transduction histidine kinase